MSLETDQTQPAIRFMPKRCAQVATFIGLSVLAGWILHVRLLLTVLPGFVAMKPNNAVCFFFAGINLFLFAWPAARSNKHCRTASAALAFLVIFTGALTLAEYATGFNFGIDELLIYDDVTLFHAPGRMAPVTAFSFVCFGVALFFLRSRKMMRWAHALTGIHHRDLLQDLIPMCSYCQKVRDGADYWERVDSYIKARTNARFTHGICPECFAGQMKELNESLAENTEGPARRPQPSAP
jgi:hypothetical protein